MSLKYIAAFQWFEVRRPWFRPTDVIRQQHGPHAYAFSTIFCFMFIIIIVGSRDSAVGIATGYGLEDRGVGVRVPVGAKIFSFPCRPDRSWGPIHPRFRWEQGTLSSGVKRLGREADHSSPTSAGVKKTWFYTSTLPYVSHTLCSVTLLMSFSFSTIFCSTAFCHKKSRSKPLVCFWFYELNFNF
jgi:hypothetical protein